MKTAFITGITGQDGSYLAEFLISKGYEVHGLVRRSSSINRERIEHLRATIHLHYGDLSDSGGLTNLLHTLQPQEIYHLGAQSHVRISFDIPEYTSDVVGIGTIRILEAIRNAEIECKFYQASSSEMFGTSPSPQCESTPLLPQSPYAVAKLMGYHATCNYRDAYGLFACNGILFNHESERRGENFVSKKITQQVAKIKLGIEKDIVLGNLDAKRDWGYAPEYVEAMWLMLQQDKPEDFVIATGEAHSVREFVEKSFRIADIDIRWEGRGINEKGIDSETGKPLVRVDPRYLRPAEVDELLGDPSYARKKLGWKSKTSFDELVEIMVKYDLDQFSKQQNSTCL